MKRSLEELHELFHKSELDCFDEFIKLFDSIQLDIAANASGIKQDATEDYNNCPWLKLVDGLRTNKALIALASNSANNCVSLWKQQRRLSSTDISLEFLDVLCIAMAISIASLSRHNLQVLTEQMLVKQAAENNKKKWGSDA